MKPFFSRSFMGTDLTMGGALTTIALAPIFWLVAGIAYAALPV